MYAKTEGDEILKLKKEIIKYTIIVAEVAALISLFIFDQKILFPYGLAVGVCAAAISLGIISSTIEKAVQSGRRGPVVIGFYMRVFLYGGALVLAARTGGVAVFGAAIGMLIPHLVIYMRHAIVPAFRRKVGKEPAPVYVTDTKSRVFFKEPWMVKYRRGRAYLTHRHFRKVNIRKVNINEGGY